MWVGRFHAVHYSIRRAGEYNQADRPVVFVQGDPSDGRYVLMAGHQNIATPLYLAEVMSVPLYLAAVMSVPLYFPMSPETR